MLVSSNGRNLLIFYGVGTVFVTLILIARLMSIKLKKRSYRMDDWFAISGYVNTLALTGTAMWAIANGLGAHTSELTPYELGVQYKQLIAVGFEWLLATASFKLSILWLYTTIFTSATKARYAAYVLMGLTVAFVVAFFPVFATNCTPISESWHPVPGGHCRPVKSEEFASVSVNMILDFLAVVLPLPTLWHLQMAMKNKIFITIMFSLGLTVVGMAAWRIKVTSDSFVQTDFVFGLYPISYVTTLELWLGLIACCLPTMTPIFTKYMGPLMSRISGFSKQYHVKIPGGPPTFGSAVVNRFRNRGRNTATADSYLELGGTSVNVTNVVSKPRTESTENMNESWMAGPRGINVEYEVDVNNIPK